MFHSHRKNTKRGKKESLSPRLRFLFWCIALAFSVVVVRLFLLMVIQNSLYSQLAAGSHELYAELFPKRGIVYAQDARSGEEFPLAMNKDVFLVYANTKEIETKEEIDTIIEVLSETFSYDDERKDAVRAQLEKLNDPYEPLEKQVEETIVDALREKELPGIHFLRQPKRFYPEKQLAAHVIGFVGKNEKGDDVGRYGVEGYWNDTLSGNNGYLEGLRGAGGGLITSAGSIFQSAEDGADILLTIDRTLQYHACEEMRKAMEEYGAESASLVIMDPQSGAIRALCSLPDFDPNTYNEVASIEVYNNSTIFTPYEPGSIFKPLVMAAAINEDLVTPESVFYDTGSKEGVCQKPIRNADGKTYEDQTMTGVLENSINTGMVYVAEQLGKTVLRDYIERFGFGVKEGIELDSEVSGTIETLRINKGDKVDCYAATASFGQGITATPLQMAAAFGAIANGGTLMKPYVVQEVRHPSGRVDRKKPEPVRQVLTHRAASLAAGMMVSVVDSGHAGGAGVPGYYVAGKTGTAQIAERGGYGEGTNHSFIGFAPVDDPKFVMLVKFEKPERRFSASTAAPTFGKIASFMLQYYGVPPSR